MWLVHSALGVMGVIAGFRYVGTGTGATVLILGSIFYVAWTARRAAGVALAFAAGMLELAHQRERVEAEDALVLACLWTVVYVGIALATSAIEAATRPDST